MRKIYKQPILKLITVEDSIRTSSNVDIDIFDFLNNENWEGQWR